MVLAALQTAAARTERLLERLPVQISHLRRQITILKSDIEEWRHRALDEKSKFPETCNIGICSATIMKCSEKSIFSHHMSRSESSPI
jgi:hypothetical protein